MWSHDSQQGLKTLTLSFPGGQDIFWSSTSLCFPVAAAFGAVWKARLLTLMERGFLSSLTLEERKKTALQFFFLQCIYTVSWYNKHVIPLFSWKTFSFQSLDAEGAFLVLHTAASLFCRQQWTRGNTGAGFEALHWEKEKPNLHLYFNVWGMI